MSQMKAIYKIAIIDDNAGCIDRLRQSLSNYDTVQLVGSAQSYQNAKQLVLEKQPDLLFLDVEIPEITGIQFLREIKTFLCWPMRVVFYTVYEKYMLEAFRESAFDFLLKPYTESEFQLVMNRFFSDEASNLSFATRFEQLSNIVPKTKTFMVSTITGYKKVDPDSICYFEYLKKSKRWFATCQECTSSELKRGTTAEIILSYSRNYVQINQQQIINYDYLQRIEGKTCILMPPFDNQKNLEFSRDFFKDFRSNFELIWF